MPFARAAEPTPADLRFFETRVRPVLLDQCARCHGEKKQKGGLRVDEPERLLRGGSAGPVIVKGKPAESSFIKALAHDDPELKMPPNRKLSDQQIADLTHWVKIGAPIPKRTSVLKGDINAGRLFWSFKTPVDPPVPEVNNAAWARTPLDRFVLAALEAKGIEPAPAADKIALLRRATYDLIGLPPTPAEIDAFLQDESPDAFARVVERLLASPHYGERWGRHWLDVARYADSNGLDENIAHGNAWRYRDYVIAAFNSDKPYDRFVVEQLAGDLLPHSNMKQRHEQLIATGFLSLGPKVLAEVDETKMEMDIIDEQIDTLGRAFLGLTLGCARCHDHKFDPILTEDYYALAGIFKSTKTMESFKKIARWHENPIATDEELARQREHQQQVAARKEEVAVLIKAAMEKLKQAGVALPKNPESMFPAETKAELKKLREELAKLEKAAPELPTAMGVTDGKVVDVAVHLRGDHLKLGDMVARRVPQVLADVEAPRFGTVHSGRLELARWLVRPEHPLTSRVIVNRVWRWHFGQGLVPTPDNFGRLGERPANQPLLDWLARRFIEEGWSLKKLHRRIMLSNTYQLNTKHPRGSFDADPENRLHWRANVRRLESEAIRDSLLAVSGTLDTTRGGSLLHVKNREFLFDHTSKDTTKY
ncbi:MAG: DUF1549 domain-containing protein, partial [Gemmataceae bacterium]